jgi:hypothetical protein
VRIIDYMVLLFFHQGSNAQCKLVSPVSRN